MLKTIEKLKKNSLFGVEDYEYNFPQTRYQGSKKKLASWIQQELQGLEFETALDLFGGTGSISYLFKTMGKSVTYNDNLTFNTIIAKCLIENNDTRLTYEEAIILFHKSPLIQYQNIIDKNFEDIYFTSEENRWLDIVVNNISHMTDWKKQAIAYYALFQACLVKRPYNLFHRKNLYVRTSEVTRSFGNKKTWDTSFEQHFLKFVTEANNAVFDNQNIHIVLNSDAQDVINKNYDLVYIDPPYISSKGVGLNYHEFYHFLEGLVDYDNWEQRIDYNSKHLKLKSDKNRWCNPKLINEAFEDTINQFKDSILVISYRDDGIPTVENIVNILEKHGKNVSIKYFNYRYALSNKSVNEVLIIAK